MSQYFNVAVPAYKKVYFLGSINAARHVFPLVVKEKVGNENFILYGDESHNFLENKFEYEEKYEVIDFESYPAENNQWVEENKYSTENFKSLFKEIGGKEINKSSLIKTCTRMDKEILKELLKEMFQNGEIGVETSIEIENSSKYLATTVYIDEKKVYRTIENIDWVF